MNKVIIKYYIQKGIQLALKPLSLVPLKKDRIVFISLEGGSQNEYSCNPKYFCEYLQKKQPGKYECVWLMMHPENYRYLEKKGIRLAKHFTPEGVYLALTAKTVISNGGYFTWFPFRKDQICINTWHGGGAYKKLENDMKNASEYTRKRMEYASAHTTAYISSCRLFTEHVIRKGFLYQGDVLETGMPRNDVLISPKRSSRLYKKIRERYHLPEDAGIVLFAPTFRENEGGTYEQPDAGKILDALKARTGRTWYLFNRSHAKADGTALLTGTNDRCIDVSDYPDTQHLLCASDMLISDYSSIIWDYALTRRPLILYTPDREAYTSGRGFYVDITEWGFPLCAGGDELLDVIAHTSDTQFTRNAKNHLARLGSFEKGHACRKLLEYIEGQL